jgi:hypothetical protein
MLYDVNVSRIATATLTIRVEAASKDEAEGKALEEAHDTDFTGCVVDYDFGVGGATEAKTQDKSRTHEEKKMNPYTYDDLARDIANLTPEQRRQAVRLLEPYDDAACLAVVSLAVATDRVTCGDDEVLLDEGQVYLQS